jgi:drug/metabolite transporter (DMT)-like permease
LIPLLIYALPIGSVWAIARYGPIRSRWWRHENPLGFGLFIGGVAFLAGFIGPMIFAPSANQGPLLGIIYTGPIGTLVGFVWGFIRAIQRRHAAKEA